VRSRVPAANARAIESVIGTSRRIARGSSLAAACWALAKPGQADVSNRPAKNGDVTAANARQRVAGTLRRYPSE
jgi:hypothetical protein